MKDVMIDIETLGKGHNAAVIAIGAVFFNPLTGETGEQFYQKVDPNDAALYGQTDVSTMAWWGKQDARAMYEAFSGVLLSSTVAHAFGSYLSQVSDTLVWGNGSTFDITILESLFDAHNLVTPWQFWNVRDVRTVVDLGWRLRNSTAKQAPFTGMAHKALDDAMHQAAYVSRIFQELRG